MVHITVSKKMFVAIAAFMLLLIPAAAYAGSVFGDVDDGSTHFEGIKYMKDTGITLGCGDGSNYCPDDPVTRAQMGTFLYRMSGNAPGIAPNVNADKVDGLNASDLTRVAYDIDPDGDPVNVAGFVGVETLMSVEITAPVGGWITVMGQENYTHNASAGGTAICEISVDDIDGNAGADILDGSKGYARPVNDGDTDICSSMAAFPATGGETYTINFDGVAFVHNFDADEGTLIAQFTPFNGAGFQPLVWIPIPIITLGEMADQAAAVSPTVADNLAEIKAAINQ